MKKFTAFMSQAIVFILLFLLISDVTCSLSPAFAHTFGQPPFLKVNGDYATLYPVPLTSLYNFDLPQDLAPANFLVGQTINFELDKNNLPASSETLAKTRFDWDFADGSHTQGLITSHQFNNKGSYIVKIYADDNTTPKPQVIESVLINILPTKDYSLPQAKILVNDTSSKDSLTDILTADFNKPVKLEASKNTGSPIEYFWDFGDQKSTTGLSQEHLYPKDLSQVFVVLRVKDQNGFLSDSFVEIQNEVQHNVTASSSASQTKQIKKTNQLPYTLVALFVLVVGVILLKPHQWRF